jgi:transcriptional regulator with XRE-family HTH domain
MSTITQNLPRVRRARGLTQEELAAKSDVSIDVITRLEQGRKHAARWSTLVALADALDVTVAVLVTPPGLLAHDAPGATVDVAALRGAITYTGDLDTLTDLAEHEDLVPAATLSTTVQALWDQYQEGEFAVVAHHLPGVIGDVRRLVHASRDATAAQAQTLLATTMNAAAGIAVSFGHPDLAYLAIERAMAASGQADTELPAHATAVFLSWILIRQGRYAEAERVAGNAASRAEPAFSNNERHRWATFGNLLINASCAAARSRSYSRADDLLATAGAAALRSGADGIEQWSVFGPRVAGMYLVDNAIEAGDYNEALTRAGRLPDAVGGSLPKTWEARYLVRLAYAHAEAGHDTAAVNAIGSARGIAPEWIRYYPLAADVISEMISRPGRPNPKLAGLATHLRIV